MRTYNLAEADKIVVCLTRKQGVVRAVARGARKLKSRFGAGLEPFTLITLGYYEKEGRELLSVSQAEILQSYFSLAQNTELVASLFYFGELIVEFSPPHEPNENLFRMVRACLEAVSAVPEGVRAIVRYFEVWLLKLSGFLPELRVCIECGLRFKAESQVYFNAEQKPLCERCSQGQGTALSREAYAHLLAILRKSPRDFASAAQSLSPAALGELSALTQRLIARVLERTPRAQGSAG